MFHAFQTGISTGRAAEKQTHLTVGNGLLGQVVVDDKSVLAVVTEPLSHGASSEWRDVPLIAISVCLAVHRHMAYWRGAASEAVAATMMVYFMASFSSRVLTS
jgi:hypothetical protein